VRTIVRANLVIAGVVLAGCEPTAPAQPSFQVDVMPILAAQCVRCHAVGPIGGAPPEFRLDSFDNTIVDGQGTADPSDDQVVLGAQAYAIAIMARAKSVDNPMPPRFPLEPYQLDTLAAWAAQDPVVRGEPRPDNRPPVLTLREVGRDSSTVTLAYELHDPDGDLVVGQLCDDDGADCRFVAPLSSGNATLTIDTSTFSLPIALRAKLDDGAGVIDQVARLGEGS
jgi:hypothetical protein